MSAGAAAAAAGAAATAQAIKATGVIVHVKPDEFLGILRRQQGALVVHATSWLFGNQYLTSYKGLAFFSRSPTPLDLPSGAELVRAKAIWAPG